MKLIKYAICMIAASMLFAGCERENGSGLVFVDYDAAEAAGIVVTKFVDGPFTATIEYDYSQIKDFSTKCLSVTLVRYVIPKEDWESGNLSAYTKRQIQLQKKLCSLKNVDEMPITSLKPKAASIRDSKPGVLKLVSIDDIGAYKIEYKRNAE